jgi:malate permease and related proteins
MGVLLTAGVIVASAGAGIAAELRYPERAGRLSRRILVGSLYTLLPLITFFNLARTHIDVDTGVGIPLAYVSIAVAVGAAWLISTRVLELPRPTAGAVICCTLVANTGYLGYPLVVALLGEDSLSEAVVYDILVSAPCLLVFAFAVGAAFGERAGEGLRERVVAFFTRNPPLYAAIAALLAPDALAPDTLVDISRALVVAILPLGFFAVGAMLAEEGEHGELEFPPPLSRPAALAIGLRMGLVPGLLLLLSLPLIDLPGPYLLLAAMPSGINCLLVAHVYGLDLRVTAQAIAWSTAIAVAGALASLAI